MVSTPDLWRFGNLFVSRRDDYAIQQADGRYRRAGRRLTYAALADHLAGLVTLGTYVIDEDGMCRFAVFDDDRDGAKLADRLARLLTLQGRLLGDGIPSYLEQSRRGGHLWVLTNRLVPARLVRRWLLPYCPAGVEFYPKQAEGGSYGSLIRLPFGVHQKSGRRYGFVRFDAGAGRLVPVASDITGTLAWLAVGGRAGLPANDVLLPDAQPAPPPDRPSIVSKNLAPAIPPAPSVTSIRDWCAAHDPVAVIGRYMRLDGRGLGCCPFGEHHSDGKDAHPSFRAYRPRAAGGSCWYCYAWGKGGTLFDFFCLWYRVSPREMWRRILAGERL